jgi:hypothetical protein
MARRGRLELGRDQWLLITLSLCFIVLLCLWGFLHPGYFLYDCEHRYLPSVQERFGFKGGRGAGDQRGRGRQQPTAFSDDSADA